MKKILNYLFIFFCTHLFIGAWWIRYYFGKVSGDEMLFHLLVPLNGVNSETFISYFLVGVLPTIVVALIIYFLVMTYLGKKTKLFYSMFLICSIFFFIFTLDIHTYIYNQVTSSKFIEENYVEVENDLLEFPEKRRNLIFIFLESMENTYASLDNGGVKRQSLIPNLEKIAQENINFSNTDKLGGALGVNGSAWTVASMVSHTCGIPLKINTSSRGIIDFDKFMPGVLSIGDILEDNGYNNYLIAGSDTSYGRRDAYFKQHGNYKIYDVNDALRDKEISETVWWGFDDEKLFSLAKKQLLEISARGENFNYTMLTVDTHFEDGYLADDCDRIYDDQYSNVIACSDERVSLFLEWLSQQDFYEETTIVLVGDHKSMDTDFFSDVNDNYERTNYNVFINSVLEGNNTSNRKFGTYDLFPTTLASMGVKIKGNRLGLGVNLFSDELTIMEEYGYEYVFKELNKRSSFYNNNFLAYK